MVAMTKDYSPTPRKITYQEGLNPHEERDATIRRRKHVANGVLAIVGVGVMMGVTHSWNNDSEPVEQGTTFSKVDFSPTRVVVQKDESLDTLIRSLPSMPEKISPHDMKMLEQEMIQANPDQSWNTPSDPQVYDGEILNIPQQK